MIKQYDVYVSFRKAQSQYLSRPYRLPKDFDAFIQNKLSDKNKEALEISTNWFNTKWRNIDMDVFFQCGFELMGKGFSYVKFFDRRVLNLYIEKDKNIKRESELNKKMLIKSAKFVKKFMEYKSNISKIVQYCNHSCDGIRAPIKHYLSNNIDNFFLTWLIKSGYLKLTDDERNMIPQVADNYRKYVVALDRMDKFLQMMENKI
jgi:hypothetical protein